MFKKHKINIVSKVNIVGRIWEPEPGEYLGEIHTLNSPKHPEIIPFNTRWVKSQSAEITSQFSASWDINCNQGAKSSLIALVGLIRDQQHVLPRGLQFL